MPLALLYNKTDDINYACIMNRYCNHAIICNVIVSVIYHHPTHLCYELGVGWGRGGGGEGEGDLY